MIRAILLLALLPSCALLSFSRPLFDSCEADYRDERYAQMRYTQWAFTKDAVTRGGVVVDFGDGAPDPNTMARIDGIIERTGACLGMTIQGCALRVKIAPVFECAGVQVFQCLPVDEKMLGPGQCGGCTGANEYPSTLVVTPDLAALAHELIHAVTHKEHGAAEFRCGE